MDQCWFSAAELVAMLGSGRIIDSITMAAFALLAQWMPEFG
jgi:hypothetical protein